jgi:annexin A7/11
LYSAGSSRFGTNEEKFIEIFTSHSVDQLNEIALAYELQFDCSLEKAISSEFSGDAKDVLLLLMLSPVEIFCRALKKASVGQVGTDEDALCRIIGGTEKDSVWEIAQTYMAKYGRSLVEDLKSELSGDFRSAVLTYICTSHPGGGVALLNQLDPPQTSRQ